MRAGESLPGRQQPWTAERFVREAGEVAGLLAGAATLGDARSRLRRRVAHLYDRSQHPDARIHELDRVIVRDCARAWLSILHPRSERLAGFSVAQALWDAARGVPRPELSPAFWAEVTHLAKGVSGRVRLHEHDFLQVPRRLKGRAAAIFRSDALDELGAAFDLACARYPSGLDPAVIAERERNRTRILRALGGNAEDWNRWNWHLRHVALDDEALGRLTSLTPLERETIRRATSSGIPFGVTPYYASLFCEDPGDGRDRAVRAQVIPPPDYVEAMSRVRDPETLDFMREADTSPVDLVTRRYATICILKPYNACPQICVYCQRNFEIKGPLAPGAAASRDAILEAMDFIARRPHLHEVLVTGGDPLVLSDRRIAWILGRLSEIPHVERVRIGTRTLVTMPMRVTRQLCKVLADFRVPGRREVAVVTHVEHPMEVTPELAAAVDRLRLHGIPVYNQLVFTFFVSRRFEAAWLRRLLRRCGIDPYYTFNTKGKDETRAYRVPIARLLQELKEEARLLPGLARTDAAVYNLPAIGKNDLASWQHRDLISILPDGSRLYEFHPWEKKIAAQRTYLAADVPILDYLNRLERFGEDSDDYESIWYYF